MDAAVSYADPPFAIPPDIVLDLPAPPSVNKTRQIDWVGNRFAKKWATKCHPYVLAAKANGLKLERVRRFELLVTLSEASTKQDLDNGLKTLIDYLRRIELIEDDGPQHMRAIHITWGWAPLGCRVIVRRCE